MTYIFIHGILKKIFIMNNIITLLINASSGASSVEFADGPVGNPAHINLYFYISVGIVIMLLLLKKLQKGVPEEYQIKEWSDFRRVPDFGNVSNPKVVAASLFLWLDLVYQDILAVNVDQNTSSRCVQWGRNYFIYIEFCKRFCIDPDSRAQKKYKAVLGLLKIAEVQYNIDWHALERFFMEEISPYLERRLYTILRKDVNDTIYAD